MTVDETPTRFDMVGMDDIDTSYNPQEVQTTGGNPLDALRAAIQQEVVKKDLTLEVITRPGMSIRFGTNIDLDTQISRWRKSCKDKSQPDDFNLLKFGQLVIANTAIAISLNGVEPTGKDGETISFRSEEPMEWTGTKRPLDAVRKIYANDAHIVATAQDILEAAGYGDEMMEAGADSPI